MPYTDKDQLLADYLPEARSNAEKDAIGRILDNVSAFVDSYCDRTPGYFNPAGGTATMKRVRGEGGHFLRLPHHVLGSIASVTLNGTAIDDSTYYESEKNGWLYFEDNNLLQQNSFDYPGCRRIWYDGIIYKVTARWGYESTPLDLQEAVRLIVARIWETQKGTLGQITPTGFVIERAMPLLAREILDKYKRRQFEI